MQFVFTIAALPLPNNGLPTASMYLIYNILYLYVVTVYQYLSTRNLMI